MLTVTRRFVALSAVGGAATFLFAGPAHAAAPTVHCVAVDGASSRYAPQVRPARCDVFGPGEAFAGGAALRKLKWRSWGAKTATATGTSVGFRERPNPLKATVRLTGLERGRCGATYGKMRVTTRHGTWLVRLHRCPRPAV